MHCVHGEAQLGIFDCNGANGNAVGSLVDAIQRGLQCTAVPLGNVQNKGSSAAPAWSIPCQSPTTSCAFATMTDEARMNINIPNFLINNLPLDFCETRACGTWRSKVLLGASWKSELSDILPRRDTIRGHFRTYSATKLNKNNDLSLKWQVLHPAIMTLSQFSAAFESLVVDEGINRGH